LCCCTWHGGRFFGGFPTLGPFVDHNEFYISEGGGKPHVEGGERLWGEAAFDVEADQSATAGDEFRVFGGDVFKVGEGWETAAKWPCGHSASGGVRGVALVR